MNSRTIIEKLNLAPHPKEGGYFRRTFESERFTSANQRLMTAIYYLLDEENPTSYLHRNRADILHFFHIGSPIRYWTIDQEGKISSTILGPDISSGHQLQLLVRGGEWKASELTKDGFALISEAVAPGFDYQDNELATPEWLSQQCAEVQNVIGSFIKIHKSMR